MSQVLIIIIIIMDDIMIMSRLSVMVPVMALMLTTCWNVRRTTMPLPTINFPQSMTLHCVLLTKYIIKFIDLSLIHI